ncbi:hypothetical protein B5X24_HaOG204514 [Helicoverpa armigera]|uniref:Uncharacterized protein n=1 Tax=Helicoverpa armigera TaxID=29058 RepID=A0A2W1BS71_HELAM|nr:hypothetical protein B5X24_HaOG204514 [Helicoverpa armigera]
MTVPEITRKCAPTATRDVAPSVPTTLITAPTLDVIEVDVRTRQTYLSSCVLALTNVVVPTPDALAGSPSKRSLRIRDVTHLPTRETCTYRMTCVVCRSEDIQWRLHDQCMYHIVT